MPTILFVISMIYMSCLHIYRMWIDYGGWKMDATTFMLPLVTRVSSLGHCVRDGTKKGQEYDSMSERKRHYKIRDVPTLFDLIGYMTIPMCCVCGPFIEYMDYKNFLEQSSEYKNIPSSKKQTISCILQAVVSMVMNLLIPMFIIDCYQMYTPSFLEKNFFVKLVLI